MTICLLPLIDLSHHTSHLTIYLRIMVSFTCNSLPWWFFPLFPFFLFCYRFHNWSWFCCDLVYVCLIFQWETIDLTSSPVETSQSSEVLLDSASDTYSSITDSVLIWKRKLRVTVTFKEKYLSVENDRSHLKSCQNVPVF